MSFFNKTNIRQCGRCFGLVLFAITVCLAGPIMAKDTDVYQVSTKNNAMVLMDTSGSMEWAVYEYKQDYAAIYDYFYNLSRVGVVGTNYVGNHEDPNKIFLIRGDVDLRLATIKDQNGEDKTKAFTGDTGAAAEWDSDNVYITWQVASIVDTHTILNPDRTLSWDEEGGTTQRITVGEEGTDEEGLILLDGATLPLGQSIEANAWKEMPDSNSVPVGFGALMQAPGVYFSGYSQISPSMVEGENGDVDIYFFATGNWINMQTIFNLKYTSNPNNGLPAWVFEEYPVADSPPDDGQGTPGWETSTERYAYPEHGGNYGSEEQPDSNWVVITRPGAAQIRVQFSEFDLYPDGDGGDYIVIRDGNNNEIGQYESAADLEAGGWSPAVAGDTIQVGLRSNTIDHAGGWTVTETEYLEDGSDNGGTTTRKIETRLEAAQKAFDDIIKAPEFKGKVNWGFATFNSGDGAIIRNALDPTVDDDVQIAAISSELSGLTAGGGTPLGEALQDVFQDGFYAQREKLGEVECRKNFIISMTDGYPSRSDRQWDRIPGAGTFYDIDGDGWTTDPGGSSVYYDYYDDVAHWIYTHSWRDKTAIPGDPSDSYFNATSHHIAFGLESPILEDAALSQKDADGNPVGFYTATYNKAQLKAAFYTIATAMKNAVAFTAPVASVDAANKIQNGEDLYLGFFLPQGKGGWAGNLKKLKFGNGKEPRKDIWMLYDRANQPVINSEGRFLDNRSGFWGDDDDINDTDSFGGHDVKEDGVGEVLTERVATNFGNADFYERPIYTYLEEQMTRFEPDNELITQAELGVNSDDEKRQTINYVHGYSYATDPDDDTKPARARSWALGSILHSSPVVVDYYKPSAYTVLDHRYLVVGSNDGMLHVFDDETGEEIFAFIPPGLLSKLKSLPENPLVEMVDGEITLYRHDKKPKYLVFGLRRGGDHYWCLDVSDTNPLNWQVVWSYSHDEMGESWSKPQLASIPVDVNPGSGEVTFKDVVIFAGGYDTLEDNFPEPFNDVDNNGNPFDDSGDVDSNEWDASDNLQDVNNNNTYDRYNPDGDNNGRGLFVVDIADPENESMVAGDTVLPFSVTHGASDVTTGNAQTLKLMKYCFPATPSVVTTSLSYFYTQDDVVKEGRKTNVLDAIYATDIYANIYKLTYKFEIVESDGGTFSVGEKGWTVTHIFSGNPGSKSSSGQMGKGVDDSDQGRKTFYSPAVSWGGACEYFDKGNYMYPETIFSGRYEIASLYIGTGDREHPTYTMIRNRLYAVYDDTSVEADNDGTDVVVGTAPYTEDHLLNLSCDELGEDTELSGFDKDDLKKLLLDDPTYVSGDKAFLEDGAEEDDAKGWYIVLEDQGDDTECSHCDYPNEISNDTLASRDNHDNEKILSRVELFAGVLYFTSYQPADVTECNPKGYGFIYSLNYCDATAAYNLQTNDEGGDEPELGLPDRYTKLPPITGPPSDVAIITREGQAGAMVVVDDKIIGPDDGFRIKSPAMGLELYYWREGNSQEPLPTPPPEPPAGP